MNPKDNANDNDNNKGNANDFVKKVWCFWKFINQITRLI